MPPKGMLTSGYDDKLYDVYLITDYKKATRLGTATLTPINSL